MASLGAKLGTATRRALVRASWRFRDTHAIAHRHDFPRLLNQRGLVGEGVEVGTCNGFYAHRMLRIWRGRVLHCVDPWKYFAEEYVDACNVNQQEQDSRYLETKARLAAFGDRCRLHRMTSAEAARLFRDGQLDFVYIDAQHHYEAVREDIRLWTSKVKPGGFIAGHDFLDGLLPSGMYGVKSAVEEWTSDNHLRLEVSQESYPSWFVRKAA